jgi:DNA primase
MACHLAGVTTAIATCGTAFGGDHIKILRRLLMDNSGAEVVFTFDGDEAGQKAALRAFEDDQKFAAETSIAITPGGMDPCELRLAEGDAAVQRLMDNSNAEVVFTFDGDAAGQKAALRAFEDDQKFAAETSIAITPGGMDPCELRLAEGDSGVARLVENRTPLFAFALRTTVDRYNLDTAEGRASALEAGAPIVAGIKNSAIQHEYAVQLAGMLGILDSQFVVRRVSQLARWQRERKQSGAAAPASRTHVQPQQSAPASQAPRGPRLDLRSPAHRVERELLKLALQHPHLVSPAFDAYGEDEFTAAPYAAVRRVIAEAGGAEPADDDYLTRVRDIAPDDTVRAMVTELAVEPVMHKAPDIYAGEVLVRVRLLAVDRRVGEVRASLSRLGPRADPDQLTAVQNELWALQQYGQRLREQGAGAL